MADNEKTKPAIDKHTGAELQTPEEIAATAKAKNTDVNPAPVRAGKYVVAGHTSVRSLDQTFKPGDPFTGAVGDIEGLKAVGALKLVEE